MSAATEKQKTIDLLLIAQHALLRESIGRMLSNEPDFTVAAECATVNQALEILKRQPIDVALLDFDLAPLEAAEAVRTVRMSAFKGKVLLLGGSVGRNDEAELIRAGVCGFFDKGDSAASLGHAIRHIAAGNVWFKQEHLRRALIGDEKPLSKSPKDRLTRRERQVLSFVAEGLKNREIGLRIGVSEGSIKASIQQLFSKFGVRSRSQLVRIALEQNKHQP